MKKGITAETGSFRKVFMHRRSGARFFVCFIALTILFTLLIMFFAAVPSFAGAGTEREKLYTSVLIEEGDSLWSIASEHACPEYSDTSKFIREVMSINHLTDEDSIHEGAYLVIPYYADIIG